MLEWFTLALFIDWPLAAVCFPSVLSYSLVTFKFYALIESFQLSVEKSEGDDELCAGCSRAMRLRFHCPFAGHSFLSGSEAALSKWCDWHKHENRYSGSRKYCDQNVFFLSVLLKLFQQICQMTSRQNYKEDLRKITASYRTFAFSWCGTSLQVTAGESYNPFLYCIPFPD